MYSRRSGANQLLRSTKVDSSFPYHNEYFPNHEEKFSGYNEKFPDQIDNDSGYRIDRATQRR